MPTVGERNNVDLFFNFDVCNRELKEIVREIGQDKVGFL